MKIGIEPLTRDAFAPFGDVIETTGAENFLINNGSTIRYHDLANVQTDAEGRVLINIFRATPLEYPLDVQLVERHPKGSQAFVPLNDRPYLVLVAPKGETVRGGDLRAFMASGQQGVNYHAGTWHHPVLALHAVSDFLVIDRGGEGDNCDEFYFDDPYPILSL
ncbi:ureidoglycolate lyase [Sneathiella chungangensis]|uniref:Ureidoglycolate lyase n=1 Tax=Sneathiella chungangensis TaxID=1418234 RepID=A0A845MDH7_9PROT|nr:ureidoglycolate lyase [Sneathiella chungangensis]MZR21959.1 ureidoglycolate lyase [Sneathiella chungangensis]